MKCFASLILLAITSIATVFARSEVGKYSSVFNYILYDDGTATIVGTYYDSMRDASVPPFINFNNKQFIVNAIAGYAFVGKEITKFTIDGSSTITIEKNAFSDVRGLKEFYINNKNVQVQIGGFNGVGTYVQFQGEAIQDTVDRYCETLLRSWKLPVRNNFKYSSEANRARALFALGKSMQKHFGIYDKVAYPDNAANVAFIGSGSSNGVSRLYRIMANVMGVSYTDVLTGCDNIHYCWNYVKNDSNKWYVFDFQKPINQDDTYSGYFQKESTFITKTLNKYYGSEITIDPHKFIVFNNRYNYPYENNVNNLPNYENFDTWLSKNNAGERTL